MNKVSPDRQGIYSLTFGIHREKMQFERFQDTQNISTVVNFVNFLVQNKNRLVSENKDTLECEGESV
ncbi:MAG: hypothetical protein U0Z75_02190 [Deinococcaceae bacterium]